MNRVAALAFTLAGAAAIGGCSSGATPVSRSSNSSLNSPSSTVSTHSTSPAPTVAAPTSPFATGARYLALGDSYTAGPLIYQATQPLDCGRSTNNYPSLIARAWKLKLTDVSCSGNKTADVTTAGKYPAQLSAVTADTKLVTLSIGGNDGSIFGNLVAGCVTQGGACPTSDTAVRADLMNQIDSRVRNILKQIHSQAPSAKTFVVGYPTILGTDATCAVGPGTDPKTTARIAGLALSQLNSALADAASNAGATFIDITDLTRDHSICAKVPWINGMAFSDDGAPLHPRAAYMRAVATYIMQQIAQ